LVYLVLVALTLLSCILFEYSKLSDTLKKLIASYKKQFQVMSDKSITDEAKQKMLFDQIGKQLALIAKLVFGIFLFIAPFLSLFLLQRFEATLNPDILITWWGILIPIITVILYILIKRSYGKLLRNR